LTRFIGVDIIPPLGNGYPVILGDVGEALPRDERYSSNISLCAHIDYMDEQIDFGQIFGMFFGSLGSTPGAILYFWPKEKITYSESG
jgi:hypothetical protein